MIQNNRYSKVEGTFSPLLSDRKIKDFISNQYIFCFSSNWRLLLKKLIAFHSNQFKQATF